MTNNKMSMSLKGFCAAPWTEGGLDANGNLYTCCRNYSPLGNWQTEGLLDSWQSPAFQAFRQKIVDGIFPDDRCKACFHNGTARTLTTDLSAAFNVQSGELYRLVGYEVGDVQSLASLFSLKKHSDESSAIVSRFSSRISKINRYADPNNFKFSLVTNKLLTLCNIVNSFLNGELLPKEVAPLRQVMLSKKCNARCVQCPYLFTGELANGLSLPGEYIEEAFSHMSSVIDFFNFGAEYFVYNKWKDISKLLVDNGIKHSISTNGILLTPNNIHYLIDNKIISKLNISMDGATKETIESIRVNVNYDNLLNNISNLFEYATEQKYQFDLSISFCLMKDNYKELPYLVWLIDTIRNGRKFPAVNIFLQGLEYYDYEGYSDFVALQHHSTIDIKSLISAFDKTLTASERTGIPVSVFYTSTLENFIADNYPFPPLVLNIDTPPFSYQKPTFDTKRKFRFGLIVATRFDMDASYNRLEPLGIGSLAAYIENKLPDVEVIMREHIDDLILEKPDIIGISSITENYSIAISWGEKIRRELNVPVIVGGVHITLLPHSMKKCFDVAVIGEGELTAVDLLSSIIRHNGVNFDELKSIPGLFYYHKEEPVFTGQRDFIQNLDDLPHLKRDKLPFWRAREDAHIITSRGCPYKCNFCSSTKLFPEYRSNSVEYIVEEIEVLIKNYGIRHITIFDDLLVANRKKFSAVVQKIEEKGLNRTCAYNILLRSNIVDDELCVLLKKLNTFGVAIGIESFSDNVLKYYNKTGVTSEINQKAIDLLNNYGIPVSCCFIFGAPVETREDLITTLSGIYNNLRLNKIENVYWGLLKPYPGTEIWNWAEKNGIVTGDTNWDRYLQKNYDRSLFFRDNDEFCLLGAISKREFLDTLDEWFKKFSELKKNWGAGFIETCD